MHLHTDDFFNAIAKGFVEPWQPESQAQNRTLSKAIAAAARAFAEGNFEVVVDGVIGPWFLAEYQQAFKGYSVSYVVLRPDLAEVTRRARQRETGALAQYPPRIYDAFADLHSLESHVIDSTQQDAETTVRTVLEGLNAGRFRLAD